MNKTLYLLILLIFPLAISGQAQYTRIGPKGGEAFNFYQDGGKIWLASNTGVYYSLNNGTSWVMSSVPENAFHCDNVMSIAASQNELYAGTQNLGIFRSTDGGMTWTAVNNGLTTTSANYSDLEIAGPNALAIKPDSGLLFLTTNQGIAWQKINFAVLNSRAVDLSLNNNVLYLVTNTGLFVSANNGNVFTRINPGVTNGKLYWSNDTAYLASSNGILQSLDFGISFSPLGLTGRNVINVAAGGNFVAATVRSGAQDTIKFSTDGGMSFSNAPTNTTFAFRKVYDLTIAAGTLLTGTNYNLYCSPNQGSNWNPCDSGFISTAVRGMAASGPLVHVATTPRGIYRTADSAASWLHNGDYSHGVNGMVRCIDANGVHVYAGDTSQYYHSGDNGLTWTTGATGLSTGNVSSVYAVKSSAEVWVVQNGNPYYSINSGALFTLVPSIGLPAGRISFITGMDTNLFAAADGGFYHAGTNKVFVLTSGITSPPTSVAFDGTSYYAGTIGGGLFTSADGNVWTQINPVPPASLPANIHALAVDSGKLFIGSDEGLYSNKSGGVFGPDSLQGKIILSLLVNSGHLYVGTCGGVYTQPFPPPLPVAVPTSFYRSPDLEIYPNPASNGFTVGFTAVRAGNAQLSIRDLLGRTRHQRSASVRSGRNEFSFLTSDVPLPAGIYAVRVASEGKEMTQLLVIR